MMRIELVARIALDVDDVEEMQRLGHDAATALHQATGMPVSAPSAENSQEAIDLSMQNPVSAASILLVRSLSLGVEESFPAGTTFSLQSVLPLASDPPDK